MIIYNEKLSIIHTKTIVNREFLKVKEKKKEKSDGKPFVNQKKARRVSASVSAGQPACCSQRTKAKCLKITEKVTINIVS